MRWFVRIAASTMSLLMGCAAIANIGDVDDGADASMSMINTSGGPETTSGGTHGSSGSSGSSGTSGTSGSSGTDSGGTFPRDATVEAEPDTYVPGCTKKQDGLTCADKSECCSGGCNQALECHGCTSSLGLCNPFDSAPCCKGYFCSGVCSACLGTGDTPAGGFGGGAKSCCSRQIDSGNGKCK